MNDEFLKEVCSALSMQCRFGGKVRRFYSVAEHTVHMVRQARRNHESPHVQFLIWLHDAPEYDTGDLLPPVKTDPVIAEAYKPIERRVMDRICNKLGVPAVVGHEALTDKSVKNYDKNILAAEAKFVSKPQFGWEPYDACRASHVAFGVRIQRAAPMGHLFSHWQRAMVEEYYKIVKDLER